MACRTSKQQAGQPAHPRAPANPRVISDEEKWDDGPLARIFDAAAFSDATAPPPPAERFESPSASSVSPASLHCCGHTYINQQTLLRHHREASTCPYNREKPTPFTCHKCKKTFARKYNVQQHIMGNRHRCDKLEAIEHVNSWYPRDNTGTLTEGDGEAQSVIES